MKICILHRYPEKEIRQTNASLPYLVKELRLSGHDVDIHTFKRFDRLKGKLWKSVLWIFYAPLLVFKGCFERVLVDDHPMPPLPLWIYHKYDLIYCDDSFPFYPLLVKISNPSSKVFVRLGDLHLMYYCSGWVYRLFHAIERLEWRIVDKVLPITYSMQEYIGYGEVVNDPIDLDDFPYLPNVSKKWDVMFHGTLNYNKGVGLVIEAARKLPNLKFCIIGDGENKEELKCSAPCNVEFLGWIAYHKIYCYLASAKVGVAIRTNNPGNDFVVTQAFMQYAAVGTPVIVSARKSFAEYPYKFSSIEDLVMWIEYFVSKKDIEVSEDNRKLMEEKHDARKIGKQLASLCSLP